MLRKVVINSIKNITPKDGIQKSSELNSSVGSLINAVGVFSEQWNTQLVDLLNTLPGGGRIIDISQRSSVPNAFQNGIDAANVFLDLSATAKVENGEYFNPILNRPYTTKEYIVKVKVDISKRLSKLESSVSLLTSLDSTGLTQAQKDAIGYRIFDPASSSSPTSLDGKISILEQNIQQIVCDVFNGRTTTDDIIGEALDATDYTVTNGSVQSLGITVFDWIKALYSASGHSYSIASGKPVITHTSPSPIPQSDVFHSAHALTTPVGEDDTVAVVGTTLLTDLNRIRYEMRILKGTATWKTANTSTLGGTITNAEQLFTYASGGGTKTVANPFGFDISNITDTNGLLALPTLTSGEAINAGQFVCIDTGGQVFVANKTLSARSYVIGVAYDTVAGAALSIRVRTGSFKLSGLGGLVAGTVYYLDNAGGLTSTVTSTSGEHIARLGIALSATELLVKISDEVRVA